MILSMCVPDFNEKKDFKSIYDLAHFLIVFFKLNIKGEVLLLWWWEFYMWNMSKKRSILWLWGLD